MSEADPSPQVSHTACSKTGPRRGWIAAAAAGIGIGIAFPTVLAVIRDSSDSTTTPPRGTGVVATELAPRSKPAVAWTGDRLLVFGGYAPDSRSLLSDGALVAVDSGDSEALPPSPFAGPLLNPGAQTVDARVVVAGIECRGYDALEGQDTASPSCGDDSNQFVAATFDLNSRSWQPIKVPEDLANPSATPSDGTADTAGRPIWEMADVLGATSGGDVAFALSYHGALDREFWTYSTETGEWTHLPSPGITTGGCVAGDEVVTMATKFENLGKVVDLDPRLSASDDIVTVGPEDGWVLPSLLSAKPGGQWQASEPDSGVKFGTAPELSCMDNSAVITDGVGGGQDILRIYRFDIGTWSALPLPPAPPAGEKLAGIFHQRVWTGTELLFLNQLPNIVSQSKSGGQSELLPGRAYDPAQNSWRTIPSMPGIANDPQWTGTEVVDYAPAFTGMDASTRGSFLTENGALRYDPA